HINSVNSPLVRAGIPIAGVVDDIDGDAGLRGSQPVIGCDEFVTYSIASTVNGQGAVLKAPDLPGYVSGTVVQLTASAAGHWHFIGWSGDLAGTVNPQNITLNANRAVTATFALDSFTVDITSSTGGSGAKAPVQALYAFGSAVALTATPAVGYHFTTWSGDTATTQNPFNIIVTKNRAL